MPQAQEETQRGPWDEFHRIRREQERLEDEAIAAADRALDAAGLPSVNGFAALRVGDYVDEGTHGLNPIVVGCPRVTIGPKPPPAFDLGREGRHAHDHR